MTEEQTETAGGKPDEAKLLPPEVAELHAKRGLSLPRAWREHLGLSREDVAQRMGISPAAYAQMEAKNARPRIITLKKIAAGLNVRWEQLRD